MIYYLIHYKMAINFNINYMVTDFFFYYFAPSSSLCVCNMSRHGRFAIGELSQRI